jgi:zinc protease
VNEYRLDNGLSVLFYQIKGTGVVTSNLTYRVGARDEMPGETGLAHMLEHMLFKPTKEDLKRKIDSGAMQFERETGCILNANTWKDRTTYYFSYPREHFARALAIEAERMHDVIISEKEFRPEQGNVLSEFDMYFGDPYFAMSVESIGAAFHSHPYGHETIGFREDIEAITPERLDAFYKRYYDPHNATLIIAGDVTEKEMLAEVVARFGKLQTRGEMPPRSIVLEPKQEGLRRFEIARPSRLQILSLGVKHGGFPGKDWYVTSLLASVLAGGEDSILHKELVDTGLASNVSMSVDPSSEQDLSMLFVTLTNKTTHEKMEKRVLQIVRSLDAKRIAKEYRKTQAQVIAEEVMEKESSLNIALGLTEFVSAGSWKTFFDTEEMLKSITAKDIIAKANELFTEKNMVIGHFKGTTK